MSSPGSKVEPLDGRLFGQGQPCFGCSPEHPFGFRLAFERIEGGVKTSFTPKAQHQGPVGVMHGGLVMTLADEAAAWAILAEVGKFGFTTKVECRFAGPARIGVALDVQARVTRNLRRIIETEVQVEQAGEARFRGKYAFAIMNKADAERMMGIEMPEAWERFSR